MADRKSTTSKFAGIFQNAGASTDNPSPERVEIPSSAIARSPGRPHGKRSDPAWKQFSVLLKKETQRDAVTILRAATDESRDLSGLLQELLEQWIAGQRR